MGPDSSVFRVLGHLEDVETNVDKANVSCQLQKVHNFHVLIKALEPEWIFNELHRMMMATFSP